MLWDFSIKPIFTTMNYLFSFIIPVFNRPKEIEDLLKSCLYVQNIKSCEIVIIEDGSDQTSRHIAESFKGRLNISYYFKTNTGPGDSRNYGMGLAKSDYFIILDSDVLLPPEYIINIEESLKNEYVDCFGGPDRAHKSFSPLQKAINYSMTSFFTTGGVRGKENQKKSFQPRSFNMGLSKKAFNRSGGFSNIHPGEDPDLAIRLKEMDFKLALFPNCFVYHKRRINWKGFATQVYKFGLVRPILNFWHPKSQRLIFYFPSLFSIGFLLSIIFLFFNFIWLFLFYIIYFILIFLDVIMKEKSILIAILAICSVFIQLFGYGFAFLKSTIFISVLGNKPEKIYPFLFFKY